VGPHNLYNVDDFCPSMSPDNATDTSFTLDAWEAAMALNEVRCACPFSHLAHELLPLPRGKPCL
jgi:hypothetical protein